MTELEARAVLYRVGAFADQFAPCFGRHVQRDAASRYVAGLVNDSSRKSMQAMHGRLSDDRPALPETHNKETTTMPTDFIRDYWEAQAKAHTTSHEASWGDRFMIDLEVETIGRHLVDGMDVLDVGCANGHATVRQIQHCRLKSMTGIDFAEHMINAAQALKEELRLGESATFRQGDIRQLDFDDCSFDVVYTTRTIINLPNWTQQVQAIEECVRVARPSGKIIFCEAFWEPLVLLNSLRALRQLPPLVEHDFNRYIKKTALETLLGGKGMAFQVDDFSSVYYLGSRFLRELVTDAAAYPGYTNPINRIFFDIERQFSGGGFGIQQAYILTKPAV